MRAWCKVPAAVLRRAPVCALCLVLAGSRAEATPQITSDLTAGYGLRLLPGSREGVFVLGARADVLFGPPGPYHLRVGPWVSLRTADFDDLVGGAGLSVLAPITSTFPLVFSAGAVARLTPDPRAGIGGRLWWGSRSYNYHSVYGLTVGVWVDAQHLFGASETTVTAGLDVDLEAFALPAIFLWNWLR